MQADVKGILAEDESRSHGVDIFGDAPFYELPRYDDDIAWSPDASPIGAYFAAGEIF